MLALLNAVAGFLSQFFGWLGNRQLIDAGKAEQAVEAIHEQEKRIAQANEAVAVPDAARTERLRNRFDRSRSG